MLVQHRSGIPNFVDHPDFWKKPTRKPMKKHLNYAVEIYPLSFDPG